MTDQGRPSGRPFQFLEEYVDDMNTPLPRFLYVAACYDRHTSSAYHLLITSNEEHDPETEEGAAAVTRLLAQASERREWFTGDEVFREEVRATFARIAEEIHGLSRYTLAAIVAATDAWTPTATDDAIWRATGT